MKPEFILGANCSIFDSLKAKDGALMSPVLGHLNDLFPQEDLCLMQRQALEDKPEVRHFIVYLTLYNSDGEVLMYQRATQDSGEKKLDGLFSLGWGGHIDFEMVSHSKEGIDIDASLNKAIEAELHEELGLSPNEYVVGQPEGLLILDQAVEQVHAGLWYRAELTDLWSGTFTSDEITQQGLRFISPATLKHLNETDANLTLERWSEVVLAEI